MSKKVIPVTDLRLLNAALAVPQQPAPGPVNGPLADTLGRPLHDLRISVTDRCNFRCTYCMPKEVFDKNYRFLPHAALLSFEEITRIARAFVAQGVRKIRLTGGEPLLRKDLPVLVGMLSSLRTPDGEPPELTLTTNGSLLARKAAALKEAGLKRVTVSLDALDDGIFKTMNDADFPVQAVLEGIEEAQRAGLAPIKVNMVVKRGVNDQEILPMARRFRGTGIELRYIEYMDVGSTNRWRLDEVVPSSEVRRILSAEFPIEPIGRAQASETAERWRFSDEAGNVGFISSVTRAFCHDCNRARLSTEGKLFLCLFGHQGYDLGTPLRQGSSDEEIEQRIRSIWSARADRYSELRSAATREAADSATNEARPSDAPHKVEMHYIGG